jgi:hypothetical protein
MRDLETLLIDLRAEGALSILISLEMMKRNFPPVARFLFSLCCSQHNKRDIESSCQQMKEDIFSRGEKVPQSPQTTEKRRTTLIAEKK